jgi:hypothetical protein
MAALGLLAQQRVCLIPYMDGSTSGCHGHSLDPLAACSRYGRECLTGATQEAKATLWREVVQEGMSGDDIPLFAEVSLKDVALYVRDPVTPSRAIVCRP